MLAYKVVNNIYVHYYITQTCTSVGQTVTVVQNYWNLNLIKCKEHVSCEYYTVIHVIWNWISNNRLKQLFSLSETDGLQLKRLFNMYDIM